MSTQITTAFVNDFRRGIDFLVQQGDTRLRPASRVETGIVGEQAFFDQIGATQARKRTTRHADTPQIDTPSARRMVPMVDYDWGDLIDKPDKVRVLNDPTNSYSQNAARAMRRAMDDELIAALGGTAFTGKSGTTPVVLPAAQKIAVGAGTGMTVAKVKTASRILKAAENAEDEPWYLVLSARQEQDLLDDASAVDGGAVITSRDYVMDQPVRTGRLQELYGFRIIRSERLPTIAGPDRLCYAWRQTALLLGIAQDSQADIGPRRDKSMSMQVFYSQTLGATRMEELGVVEIHNRE
jgi:hypothetical protein